MMLRKIIIIIIIITADGCVHKSVKISAALKNPQQKFTVDLLHLLFDALLAQAPHHCEEAVKQLTNVSAPLAFAAVPKKSKNKFHKRHSVPCLGKAGVGYQHAQGHESSTICHHAMQLRPVDGATKTFMSDSRNTGNVQIQAMQLDTTFMLESPHT